MNKLKLVLLLFITVGCSSAPLNLDTAKDNIKEYYESGKHAKDVSNVVADAISDLEKIELPENPLVVFDIDETLLSNYIHVKEVGYGFHLGLWNKYLKESRAELIPETKKLYDWFIKNNVKVLFITGRHHYTCEETVANLKKVGITEFEEVICRNEKEIKLPAEVYKTVHRKKYIDNGFTIIACIGDQHSDLDGKYTGMKIKIPNHLYLID